MRREIIFLFALYLRAEAANITRTCWSAKQEGKGKLNIMDSTKMTKTACDDTSDAIPDAVNGGVDNNDGKVCGIVYRTSTAGTNGYDVLRLDCGSVRMKVGDKSFCETKREAADEKTCKSGCVELKDGSVEPLSDGLLDGYLCICDKDLCNNGDYLGKHFSLPTTTTKATTTTTTTTIPTTTTTTTTTTAKGDGSRRSPWFVSNVIGLAFGAVSLIMMAY